MDWKETHIYVIYVCITVFFKGQWIIVKAFIVDRASLLHRMFPLFFEADKIAFKFLAETPAMSPFKAFREDPGLGRRRRGIVAVVVAAVAAALLLASGRASLNSLYAQVNTKSRLYLKLYFSLPTPHHHAGLSRRSD